MPRVSRHHGHVSGLNGTLASESAQQTQSAAQRAQEIGCMIGECMSGTAYRPLAGGSPACGWLRDGTGGVVGCALDGEMMDKSHARCFGCDCQAPRMPLIEAWSSGAGRPMSCKSSNSRPIGSKICFQGSSDWIKLSTTSSPMVVHQIACS